MRLFQKYHILLIFVFFAASFCFTGTGYTGEEQPSVKKLNTDRLCEALYKKHRAEAAAIIKSGNFDLNGYGREQNMTPLAQAVYSCDLEAVRLLIAAGADPNSSKKSYDKPIHISLGKMTSGIDLEHGEYDAARKITLALLEAGAAIDGSPVTENFPRLAYSINNLELIKKLIDRGVRVDSSDCHKNTALHYSAYSTKNYAIINLLLEKGANPKLRSGDGRTAAGIAASASENQKIISLLIDKGAGIEDRDEDGRTPLFEAAECSTPGNLKLLLGLGANPNALDLQGNNTLISALKGHYYECTESIDILAGAVDDIDRRNTSGETALTLAIKYARTEAAEILKKHGAKTDANHPADRAAMFENAVMSHRFDEAEELFKKGVDIEMRSFIHRGGKRLIVAAVESGNFPALKFLVEHGAKPSIIANDSAPSFMREDAFVTAATNDDTSALQLFFDKGFDFKDDPSRYQVLLKRSRLKPDATYGVECLRKNGADMNITGREGDNALHLATDNIKLLEYFIKNGTDVNRRNKRMNTPLMIAVEAGHAGAVKLLLDGGADPNATCENGLTPLRVAAAKGMREISLLLRSHGAKADLSDNGFREAMLANAAEAGDTPEVEALLETGMKISDETIIRVMNAGRSEMLELFVERGHPINAGGPHFASPIRNAVYRGDIGAVKLCLAKGASVNFVNGLLPDACRSGKVEMAKFLIENGADISAINKVTERDLFLEAMHGRASVEMAKFLLDKGFDVKKKDHLKQTALLLAIQPLSENNSSYIHRPDPDIVKFLIERGVDAKARDITGRSAIGALSNLHEFRPEKIDEFNQKIKQIEKMLVESGVEK